MLLLRFVLSRATIRQALPALLLSNLASSTVDLENSTTQPSCALSATRIRDAGISTNLAQVAEDACKYEQSQWSNGSVTFDDFYRVPGHASNAPAGTLLKVQSDANTSAYNVPPNTALSRILFLSRDFNGLTVPASAYVLWPFAPRVQPDGYPIVAWAHGTTGLYNECAPSHYQTLTYEYAAPYELVLQGYVVVAADYAGLGVYEDTPSKPVIHQYGASRAQANDILFAIKAAQSAFKELSK